MTRSASRTAAEALRVVLPYSPFRVPIRDGRKTVNLSPNGDAKRVFYTGNPSYAQASIRLGHDQMRGDAWALTLEEMDGSKHSLSDGAYLYTVTLGWAVPGPAPDGDNIIASIKWALDGIAAALGMDDRHFTLAGSPTVERLPRGSQEWTELCIAPRQSAEVTP
ncbi:MAG: hypothetical protein Q8R28_14255 [Dehalococcoidia bacterium]|nr:hypothetical protein [Dehalococcoidia bacterium]